MRWTHYDGECADARSFRVTVFAFHPGHYSCSLNIFSTCSIVFALNITSFNLQNSYALNLHVNIQWKGLDRNATKVFQSALSMNPAKASHSRSGGLDVTPICAINLIHRRKVIHVGEEDVHLDHLVNGGTGAF